MRLLLVLLMFIASATMARATETPAIAPAPSWVRTVAPAAPADAMAEAPVQVLLHDQQMFLQPGERSIYTRTVVRLQTPQGLAVGNISIPWRPDTDVLTVHQLLIRRGTQVIDVLAAGQTFTVVRREANLESAMLDGVLTANIQPEGLQVGDVLELSATLTSRDPVLGAHVEQFGGGWNQAPVARAHVRIQWPSSLPLRLRQTADMPPLRRTERGGITSIEASADNLQPIPMPRGAPPRFAISRLVEVTDFQAWSDLARLLAPLYQTAARLPDQGPLQAEVERIRALSADPIVRTEAALALVQDRVRYVALQMGSGGLVPADAATTWARRYGDCKGKTALLLGLLRALGIEAEPVAVNTVIGDGMNERLPMVSLFDHVIVRARIGGRTYWLDGTRTGDRRLASLQVHPFGWGLPLVTAGSELVRIMPASLDAPTQLVTIHMDASGGLTLPAPTRIEAVFTGDEAQAVNMGLANLAPDARDQALREYWRQRYDFIEVVTTSAAFDQATGEQKLRMEGRARMDWSGGRYETDDTALGFTADFSREPGPNRDAPFAVPHPFFTRTVQTIVLPTATPGFRISPGADVEQTIAGTEYRRRAAISGNVATIEASQRSVASEFPASEAPTAQTALRELLSRRVYVLRPAAYRLNEREAEATRSDVSGSAQQLIDRGVLLLDSARYDEAMAQFDRAIVLDPQNPWALANRGITRVWQNDRTAAERDLDAAAAIDPRNPVVYRARGLLAFHSGAYADAVTAFSTSIEIRPDNAFALAYRARAHMALGNDERALADATAAIAGNPNVPDLYGIRADVYRRRGDTERAVAEAAAVMAANPDTAAAQTAAARIYLFNGRQAEAMQLLERAIAARPSASLYMARAAARPQEDFDGRHADIEAALRLTPTNGELLGERARLLEERGDLRGAIASWTAALEVHRGHPMLLTGRGITYARAGEADRSNADLAAARASTHDPAIFNNICWAMATAGLTLEAALADCNEALRRSPDAPSFLDSRALVLLRMGRVDEAIADYDRALALAPRQASSLFGRALARARKGNRAGADADAAAAERESPLIRRRFMAYGLRL